MFSRSVFTRMRSCGIAIANRLETKPKSLVRNPGCAAPVRCGRSHCPVQIYGFARTVGDLCAMCESFQPASKVRHCSAAGDTSNLLKEKPSYALFYRRWTSFVCRVVFVRCDRTVKKLAKWGVTIPVSHALESVNFTTLGAPLGATLL